MANVKHNLKPKETAEYLGLSPSTMAKWWSVGGDPRFYKLGGCIRYATDDLDTFLATKKHSNTAQEGGDE
ncbi:helix-turn-helix transcriptional regulator [Pseudovibrio denitrificans]|uniref:helix-turn-helix transcriptional regulator n=1 Tax=Pseudovibrio denitrificans TaxID=258256 RepID=UPI0039BFA9D0